MTERFRIKSEIKAENRGMIDLTKFHTHTHRDLGKKGEWSINLTKLAHSKPESAVVDKIEVIIDSELLIDLLLLSHLINHGGRGSSSFNDFHLSRPVSLSTELICVLSCVFRMRAGTTLFIRKESKTEKMPFTLFEREQSKHEKLSQTEKEVKSSY